MKRTRLVTFYSKFMMMKPNNSISELHVVNQNVNTTKLNIVNTSKKENTQRYKHKGELIDTVVCVFE